VRDDGRENGKRGRGTTATTTTSGRIRIPPRTVCPGGTDARRTCKRLSSRRWYEPRKKKKNRSARTRSGFLLVSRACLARAQHVARRSFDVRETRVVRRCTPRALRRPPAHNAVANISPRRTRPRGWGNSCVTERRVQGSRVHDAVRRVLARRPHVPASSRHGR